MSPLSNPTFTFHFDSIKTYTTFTDLENSEKFTFHFDSIKTGVGKKWHYRENIYISLWFY